jgi:hypothetical protein
MVRIYDRAGSAPNGAVAGDIEMTSIGSVRPRTSTDRTV